MRQRSKTRVVAVKEKAVIAFYRWKCKYFEFRLRVHDVQETPNFQNFLTLKIFMLNFRNCWKPRLQYAQLTILSTTLLIIWTKGASAARENTQIVYIEQRLISFFAGQRQYLKLQNLPFEKVHFEALSNYTLQVLRLMLEVGLLLWSIPTSAGN